MLAAAQPADGADPDSGGDEFADCVLPSLYVQDITIAVKASRRTSTFTGLATIVDGDPGVVSKAVVTAEWSGPEGLTQTQTATTRGSGAAKFTLRVSATPGYYQLCVTDVTQGGCVYRPDQNAVACQSVTVQSGVNQFAKPAREGHWQPLQFFGDWVDDGG